VAFSRSARLGSPHTSPPCRATMTRGSGRSWCSIGPP
jgi:hypothetical protein